MADEDIQRTLVAEFPGITIEVDADGVDTSAANPGYTDLGTGVWCFETVIDLSGYALQKKSFYPYSSFEQRGGAFTATFTDSTRVRNIHDTIIVSSVPLDLSAPFVTAYVNALPGFTPFNFPTLPVEDSYRINRDPLMHQRQLIHSFDTTTSSGTGQSIYRLTSDVSASSLEPTAADKLFCYRFVKCDARTGSGYLPAARVLLPGTITTEPKLEYMMRLKRSYELANQG